MSKKEMLFVIAVLAVTLTVVSALAALAGSTVAHAEPTGQYGVQLTDVEPDGRFALELDVRTFDTTGAVPPRMTAWWVRLPAGIALRRPLRDPRWQCDGQALIDAIHAHPSPRTPFNARIANLAPLLRTLARGERKADRSWLVNAQACDRARFGGGVAQIDARRMTESLPDPIPVRFALFLSRGRAPGAVAGFTIVGAADENAPIVRRNPLIGAVHAAVRQDVLEEPSPDGRFGYRLMLPSGRINGLDVSVAEVAAKASGITVPAGTCVASDRRGRCRERRSSDLFWLERPRCPASGELSAQVFTGWPSPARSSTTDLLLPCPPYSSAATDAAVGTGTHATGASAVARPAAATRGVAVRNDRFEPRAVTVRAGDAVSWNWRSGGRAHDVASTHFAYSGVRTRGSYRVVFRRAGSFPYACILHEGMNGTVVVRR